MYPAHYYGLFPAFPRKKTVFVAMSFDASFERRWVDVLAPAISAVSIDDIPLEPVRVDARVVGDSILTEILSGIGSSQVVLADISSIGELDGRPIRNGNVMYEVGLAHAVRLPEEVLLFRSDDNQLPFDTANVRVNKYAPDDLPEEAQTLVSNAIVSALREVNLQKHLAVRTVADSLDATSFGILVKCQLEGQYCHPERKTMGQAMAAVSIESAIQRLLTLGLLEVRYKAHTLEELNSKGVELSGDAMPYFITTFGKAVFHEISQRMAGKAVQELQSRDAQ